MIISIQQEWWGPGEKAVCYSLTSLLLGSEFEWLNGML